MLNPKVKDATYSVPYALSMDIETLGQRIRRLRIARGFTQAELAKRVGVTKSAVSQWEDDSTKNLKLDALTRLLDALGTDLRYLVFGETRKGPGDDHVPASRLRRQS